MKVIRAQNVCVALPLGLTLLKRFGVQEESRAGTVLVLPTPLTTVTAIPQERVLFSSIRNANPFFHLFEAIWMLAGRDDAAPLNGFVKGFGDRYGEEDGTIHGAYGMRWRSVLGIDQLNFVVRKLRSEPYTRQCVIQMWDSTMLNDDLDGRWKDRPCNTHIYLRVQGGKLDLTVCCRSNDAIWGAHGANAVHFSVLQEYLASRIGVGMGVMYQISNNYHSYLSEFQRYDGVVAKHLEDNRYCVSLRPLPMFEHRDSIDADIVKFMENYERRVFPQNYKNLWFRDVLDMAMLAHHNHKLGDRHRSLWFAQQIAAPDWRLACVEWLGRKYAEQGLRSGVV